MGAGKLICMANQLAGFDTGAALALGALIALLPYFYFFEGELDTMSTFNFAIFQKSQVI